MRGEQHEWGQYASERRGLHAVLLACLRCHGTTCLALRLIPSGLRIHLPHNIFTDVINVQSTERRIVLKYVRP